MSAARGSVGACGRCKTQRPGISIPEEGWGGFRAASGTAPCGTPKKSASERSEALHLSATRAATCFFPYRGLLLGRLQRLRLFEAFRAADEFDDLLQSVGEFRKILLVEENLVPVIGDRAVCSRHLAAFGNRQKIVVGTRGPHIEKIGPTPGLHSFRKNLISVFLVFSSRLRIG